jgi:Rhodopirellula transposase DDE domain
MTFLLVVSFAKRSQNIQIFQWAFLAQSTKSHTPSGSRWSCRPRGSSPAANWPSLDGDLGQVGICLGGENPEAVEFSNWPNTIGAALHGIAKRIRVLMLPGLPDKGEHQKPCLAPDSSLTLCACALDERTYEKGIKITDAEMEALDIRGHTFHPEWNYTVHPRPKKL